MLADLPKEMDGEQPTQGPKLQNQRQCPVSGQQELHTAWDQWMWVQWQVHKAHWYTLFFIADRVKSKEVRIEYCPTGIMLAEYFTKPLQGALFQKMKDMIMGNTDIPLPTE